jgi:hypothetical protein
MLYDGVGSSIRRRGGEMSDLVHGEWEAYCQTLRELTARAEAAEQRVTEVEGIVESCPGCQEGNELRARAEAAEQRVTEVERERNEFGRALLYFAQKYPVPTELQSVVITADIRTGAFAARAAEEER